ncbi:TlpA family protein disulfide reductase, partial [Candidatus Woesearchaeota archaeon]|nr:TlpA family protein disulfide reductase [Candidatus Woesearchaeota archaeon]
SGCAQEKTSDQPTILLEQEDGGVKTNTENNEENSDSSVLITEEHKEKTQVDWKTFPLKDVRSGKTFTISDFTGKIVLLESFAVWCPICTKQQKELQKFHEEIGDLVISISLDTDPNEDEETVHRALQERGFDWRFAVSPPELTKILISEFGSVVVNAPSAPVILVCKDQTSRLLGRGVKDAEELKEEIERGC